MGSTRVSLRVRTSVRAESDEQMRNDRYKNAEAAAKYGATE